MSREAPSSSPDFSSATVFVNPKAGRGRARILLPQLKALFEAGKVSAEFQETATAKELEEAVLTAISAGKRVLIALGGDGTFQALVNAAYGKDVILGVLPGGGGNDFAAALDLPPDSIAATKAILAGQPRPVDVVRVRTAEGERLYVAGGGIGLDAEAARHAATGLRHWPGRSRYVASALRALWSHRAARVLAEFPGTDLPPVEKPALLAAVLNTPCYGAGLRLAPEAKVDDGWLDFVMIERMHALEALGLVPGLLRNGELRTKRVTRARAKRIKLSADRTCELHGDGEILGTTPVEIEALPGAIRVLAPRTAGLR